MLHSARMRKVLLVLLLSAAAAAPQSPSASGAPTPQFEDISRRVGLSVSHISSSDALYIMESTSGGVGFIDCDNDGKLDIVSVNGSSVARFRRGGDPMITLYHQGAGLKFSDILVPRASRERAGVWALSSPISTMTDGRTFMSRATAAMFC